MNKEETKIITIGASGVNITKRLKEKLKGNYKYICIQSNKNISKQSVADVNLLINKEGLGAGGNIAKGRFWAQEFEEEIKEAINSNNEIIIVAALGGGTTSGAMPVIAKYAKELNLNAHIIALIPFSFEGERRTERAFTSIEEAKLYSDNITIISNNIILEKVEKQTTLKEAFNIVDEIIISKIKEIIW